MCRLSVLLLPFLLLGAWPVHAQSTAMAAPPAPLSLGTRPAHVADIEGLAQAIGLERLLSVMQREGEAQLEALEGELFAGQQSASWRARVVSLHDPVAMREATIKGLELALKDHPQEVARIIATLGKGSVARLVQLEIDAREVLLDPLAQDMAILAWERQQGQGGRRLEQINRVIAAGDLVEQNVVGTMNTSMAFNKGLRAGGGGDLALPDGEMMASLWEQQEHIRADTADWLMPCMLLAWQPLSDEEVEPWVRFSESAEGRLLGQALFSTFDTMFDGIAYQMGMAVGRELSEREL